MEVSAIEMGCMGFSHAEGKQTDIAEAADILREAVDLGYTYFNTGWNYGNVQDPHHNEKILGKAFEGIRDKVVISSKCGVDFDYAVNPDKPPFLLDFNRNKVRQSVEESLERLKTDYIDFYLQARIDPNTEPEEEAETMAELIREGKILHWGISETNEEYVRRANAVCPISVVENSYSILNRKNESMIPFLEENKIESIPMPVATFFEEYDFSGKVIISFCSHGGGRFGQSLTAIAKLAPEAVMKEGLSIHSSGGSSLESDVSEWLKLNGILQ